MLRANNNSTTEMVGGAGIRVRVKRADSAALFRPLMVDLGSAGTELRAACAAEFGLDLDSVVVSRLPDGAAADAVDGQVVLLETAPSSWTRVTASAAISADSWFVAWGHPFPAATGAFSLTATSACALLLALVPCCVPCHVRRACLPCAACCSPLQALEVQLVLRVREHGTLWPGCLRSRRSQSDVDVVMAPPFLP